MSKCLLWKKAYCVCHYITTTQMLLVNISKTGPTDFKKLSKQIWHQRHSATVKPHCCIKNNTLYSNFHNQNARMLPLQLSSGTPVRSGADPK